MGWIYIPVSPNEANVTDTLDFLYFSSKFHEVKNALRAAFEVEYGDNLGEGNSAENNSNGDLKQYVK